MNLSGVSRSQVGSDGCSATSGASYAHEARGSRSPDFGRDRSTGAEPGETAFRKPAATRRDRVEFWTFHPDFPSFRHRLSPLLPRLERKGWHCGVFRLSSTRYLRRIIERRAELDSSAVVVLGKMRLALGEGWLLRRLGCRVVLDIDDAIYIRQPRRPGLPVRDSWLRRDRFRRTCRAADLVLAGNETLADAARPWARRIEVVPTSVTTRGIVQPVDREPRRLVWIGRPENLPYLELIRPAIAALTRRYPDLSLRVVSSAFPDWPEIPVERVLWSEASEIESLTDCGVGLMPLSDDEWTRGKCGFKLLQYMASGLPCIASPVGENRRVIIEGVTGFLARDVGEWSRVLDRLVSHPELGRRLGEAGRDYVRRNYDRDSVVERAAELIGSLALGAEPRRLTRRARCRPGSGSSSARIGDPHSTSSRNSAPTELRDPG